MFSVLWLVLLSFINYKCPIHEYLGIWCAGCGGTRMIFSFIHLDFYQAFRWNSLMFIYLILLIIYIIVNIFVYIKRKEIIVPKMKVFMFLIILLVIFMVIRNIDMFSYLVPTKI